MKLALALVAPLVAAQILTGSPIRLPADDSPPTGPGTIFYDGMPPTSFPGTGTVTLVLTNDVGALCGYVSKPLIVRGCAKRGKDGKATIVMENPRRRAERGDRTALILAHELAHLQGWPADHPIPPCLTAVCAR